MDDTHTLDPGGQGQSVIGLHFKPSMRPPSPGASTVPAPAWPGLLPSSLKDYTYVAAPWEALPQYKSSPSIQTQAKVMVHLFYDDCFSTCCD